MNGLWVRALRAFFSVAFVIVSGSILLAAPAGDYGPWRWNTELPSQLRKAPTIRADRTPEAVAHLFREHPSLARVLETLGLRMPSVASPYTHVLRAQFATCLRAVRYVSSW